MGFLEIFSILTDSSPTGTPNVRFFSRAQIHYGMLDQQVGTTNWTNMFDKQRIDYFRVQIHYGLLDQQVSTTSWTNMLYELVRVLVQHVGSYFLYQHVGPTFHS